MADAHLKGSLGSNGQSGLTWAAAVATLKYAAENVALNGGRVFCDRAQSESGAAVNITIGARDAPVHILSGTPGASTGLTALSGYSDPRYTYNGTGTLQMIGFMNVERIIFNIGAGQSTTQNLAFCVNGDNWQRYKFCDFVLQSTGASSRLYSGDTASTDGRKLIWDHCGAKFQVAGQGIRIDNSDFTWNGGGLLSGTAQVTNLFHPTQANGRGSSIQLMGVDLSLLANTFNFITNPLGMFKLLVRGCKLPSGWPSGGAKMMAGVLVKNAQRAEMYDCDDGQNGKIRFIIEDVLGTATEDTTVRRTGIGDPISDYSIKIVTNNDDGLVFPHQGFLAIPLRRWVSQTGSQRTLRIELGCNNTLTNKDFAVRLRFSGDSNSPLLTSLDSMPTQIASATTLSSSSVTWNNAPTNRYRIDINFTPEREGHIYVDLITFKKNETIYVSPDPEIL